MSHRLLFIASLHHPERLLTEQATAPDGQVALFPTSMGQHFWERAMRRRGYALDVFWRNMPGFGRRDISSLRADVHRQGLTPGKVAAALMRRLPPQANPDYRRRNQMLIEQAERFQPDLIWLVGDNTVITAETLATIRRRTGAIVIYASGTSPIVFSHPIERAAARLYDLVLVNDFYHGMQWRELGAPRVECLPIAAIDPDFHQLFAPDDPALADLRCDVGFVGTLVPDQLYSERTAALAALRDFDLGIWSVHEVPPELRDHHRGYALGADMLRVLAASKISLNVHGDFMRYGGNMRLFEAAAVGAFQIVDDRPGVSQWFQPGQHLVTFSDHDTLRDKVRYYLAHDDERAAMTQAALDHVRAHHKYDKRLQQVEALLDTLR